MPYPITRLSPLIHPLHDDDAQGSSSQRVNDKNFYNQVVSSFTEISETHGDLQQLITQLSQSPHFTSDPQKLLLLQNYIGEYSNYISLVSSLVRKGVSTIETLEKS
ncbi:type III secretion system inner rod subunit SctI [Tatumella ptyseos]|uniref:type III secretion system inner rod subunit SctI n=1 Tax=Tatumella ptyseos TaxID=82987 RepID=UPI0026F36F92|nr:type III secretion system inner rod subunit SctI [Tatumella ptyseos]WKX25765.1 type III secretion system inner rod subunit SctI [Tatumella ptyseos]